MNLNLETKPKAGAMRPNGLPVVGTSPKAAASIFIITPIFEDPRPFGMIANGSDADAKQRAVLAACREWVRQGGHSNPYHVVDALRELPPEHYREVLSILSDEADSLRVKFAEGNRPGVFLREFNRLQVSLSTANLYDRIARAGYDYLSANEAFPAPAEKAPRAGKN